MPVFSFFLVIDISRMHSWILRWLFSTGFFYAELCLRIILIVIIFEGII